MAEEERALALAEIEKARVSIEKVEKALQVHDSASSSREKEVLPYFTMDVPLTCDYCICIICSLSCCKVPLAHIYLYIDFRPPNNQEIEELKKEVREARRIKMLHQPSKVCFTSLVTLFFF